MEQHGVKLSQYNFHFYFLSFFIAINLCNGMASNSGLFPFLLFFFYSNKFHRSYKKIRSYIIANINLVTRVSL